MGGSISAPCIAIAVAVREVQLLKNFRKFSA